MHRTGCLESSFSHQLHRNFIIIPVRIGKVFNGNPEAILQLFFARKDFLLGLLAGKARQARMGTGVGPDPVTRGKPLPNL